MNTGKWWLRLYRTSAIRTDRFDLKPQYNELIIEAFDMVELIRHQVKIDAVELDTGKVARHDYKKPLPKWIEDPLLRQMVAATGKIP